MKKKLFLTAAAVLLSTQVSASTVSYLGLANTDVPVVSNTVDGVIVDVTGTRYGNQANITTGGGTFGGDGLGVKGGIDHFSDRYQTFYRTGKAFIFYHKVGYSLGDGVNNYVG